MSYTVLKPWVPDKKSALFNKYQSLHTGVDVDIVNVKAIASGVVKHIGTDNSYQIVTIEFDDHNALRYGHLISTQLIMGSIVSKGDIVGTAHEYMHFEYLKSDPGNPLWPVRFGNKAWYKHDPTSIILGTHIIDKSGEWINSINLNTERPGDYSLGQSDDGSPDPNEEP